MGKRLHTNPSKSQVTESNNGELVGSTIVRPNKTLAKIELRLLAESGGVKLVPKKHHPNKKRAIVSSKVI